MNCTHRWRIDEPNGPLSYGRCQSCGAERSNFLNAHPSDVDFVLSRDGRHPGQGERGRANSHEKIRCSYCRRWLSKTGHAQHERACAEKWAMV